MARGWSKTYSRILWLQPQRRRLLLVINLHSLRLTINWKLNPEHLQQHFPYRSIYTRAYNADNGKGVAGVADVTRSVKPKNSENWKARVANIELPHAWFPYETIGLNFRARPRPRPAELGWRMFTIALENSTIRSRIMTQTVFLSCKGITRTNPT